MIRNTRLSFFVPFAGITLFVVLVLAHFLNAGYQEAIRSAEQTGHNEANILANRFGSVLDHARADLDYIAAQLAPSILDGRAREDEQTHADALGALRFLGRSFREIQGYVIIDADGMVVLDSDIAAIGIDVSDRDYFKALKAAPDEALHYSEVVSSRLDGKAVLLAHRAVLDPSGRFLGLVMAPILLDRILELFAKLDFGRDGMVSIRRADDSRLVVRRPDWAAEVNQPASNTVPFVRISGGEREGVTRNPGKVDGVERIFYFKVVDGHPFYVLVGRGTDEILAHWRFVASLTILLALGVFGAAALTVARLRQRSVALDRRERIMSAIVGQANDAIELTDLESLRFVEFNDKSCELLGYTREEYARLRVPDIQAELPDAALMRLVGKLQPGDATTFETIHRRKDGELLDVQVSLNCVLLDERRYIVAIWRDITQRRQRERLLALRHDLASQVRMGDQEDLLRKALDAAESLTHSQIGFLHFVEPDEQTVSLQVWSSNTLERMCSARGEGAHYPIAEAGVWVDCILQRRPVLHNDYAALPHRKGLPEGHAPIVREATVPLFRDGRIVAVIGVGNKATDYNQSDVDVISEIIEMTFDFVERQQAEKQVAFMAYHDTLTGLPNRALILDQIRQAIGQCRRSNALVVVGYLNLDGFKPINDSYGYDVGDAVLMGVAKRLDATLRQGDSLARVGGDEFVLMLAGLANADECDRAMRRVQAELNRPVEIDGVEISVLASIGATFFPLDDVGADALVHHAHQAMFQAKRSGPAGYRLYDHVQEHQMRERRRIRDEFSAAFDRNQLKLFYQPKIALEDGGVVGVEALIRWQHPEHGLLAPGDFLPQIENTPLDVRLGEWVLINAITQQRVWADAGIKLVVSVNISPLHLQSPGFRDFLEAALADCQPECAQFLELEILEISSIANAESTSELMRACRSLGVRFSLDDFGTGYSSLTHFHNLPIDVVKIDQNFVRGMLDRQSDRDIVQGVLSLAAHLGRPVVAEGVESMEIGLLLLELGCQSAQGFGIARPMPAEQLPDWLKRWAANSRWHRLGKLAHAGHPDPDLDVAIFSHHNWLDQLAGWLDGAPDTPAPELSADCCAFEHWYHGVGQQRFGAHPSYAFIAPKHHQLHALARELVDAAQDGRDADADRLRAAIAPLSEELVGLLIGLGRGNAAVDREP